MGVLAAIGVVLLIAIAAMLWFRRRLGPAWPQSDKYAGMTLNRFVWLHGRPSVILEGFCGFPSEEPMEKVPEDAPAGPHRTAVYRRRSGKLLLWMNREDEDWTCFSSLWMPELWLRPAPQVSLEDMRRPIGGQYPTPATIDEWQDTDLFTAVAWQALVSHREHGFESLNDVEKVLCALWLFDSEVNSSGFGQWLCDRHPSVLSATPSALKTVGATEMASFVQGILDELRDLGRFDSQEEWAAHFESLPESYHESIDGIPAAERFIELEGEFQNSAGAYARAHWQKVRTE